ncbi:MAG: Sua5/YciO/YrdC/YwlC family protein [Owenweeksia sp.]|nr:Sua5/YciO/YrdC/YwlC family protein [Owenweeksia sp.]
METYCGQVPDLFYELYEKFSPGPITYILPKSEAVPDIVTSGHNTVGIRFPQHPLTRNLLLKVNLPLAAPSANPFGYVSPTTAAHVEEQMGSRIDYILDGGACEVGLESTIIDLSGEKAKILRLGGTPHEEIEAIAGPLMVNKTSTSNPSAPGMLSSHYATGKTLVMGSIEDLLQKYPRQRAAILSLNTTYPQVPINHQRLLSHKGDLKEAAGNLFSVLRQLDKMDVDIILAERFPDEGLGHAINDRLERAAAKR